MSGEGWFKNGGRLHRVWLQWAENFWDHLWPWRWICWVAREHQPHWNYGRTYCVVCGKTLGMDPWRVERDRQKRANP
mgnify:CR=1 FL=1